jgi:hypothetical protein
MFHSSQQVDNTSHIKSSFFIKSFPVPRWPLVRMFSPVWRRCPPPQSDLLQERCRSQNFAARRSGKLNYFHFLVKYLGWKSFTKERCRSQNFAAREAVSKLSFIFWWNILLESNLLQERCRSQNFTARRRGKQSCFHF